ncbi:MAG TPA: MarR family transcriptional regulator, partial [candidate division Zixibacteria bacterium]|nr:MarR family transcriptional regulator [candidate division Zixibacteria bacterium]
MATVNEITTQAFVGILKVHDRLLADVTRFLEPHGLTEPQYNVLRILRGAEPEGLPCHAIAERMITRVPDITRLVDRLENAGLAFRARGVQDRRVVQVAVTRKALRLLDRLDKPMQELHSTQFAVLKASERRTLARI